MSSIPSSALPLPCIGAPLLTAAALVRSFVFSDPTAGLTAEEMQLANLVTSYWVDFAKHGSPNGEDRPFWPPYTAATDGTGDSVLVIELPEEGGTRMERGLRKAACDLQEQITRQDAPRTPGLPPPPLLQPN